MSAKVYSGTTPTHTHVRDSVESIVRVHDNDGVHTHTHTHSFVHTHNMQIPSNLNKSFDDYFNVNFKTMKCGEAYIFNTRGQFTDFEIGNIENPRESVCVCVCVCEHGGVSSCEDVVCYAEDSVCVCVCIKYHFTCRRPSKYGIFYNLGCFRWFYRMSTKRWWWVVDVTPMQINVYVCLKKMVIVNF